MTTTTTHQTCVECGGSLDAPRDNESSHANLRECARALSARVAALEAENAKLRDPNPAEFWKSISPKKAFALMCRVPQVAGPWTPVPVVGTVAPVMYRAHAVGSVARAYEDVDESFHWSALFHSGNAGTLEEAQAAADGALRAAGWTLVDDDIEQRLAPAGWVSEDDHVSSTFTPRKVGSE